MQSFTKAALPIAYEADGCGLLLQHYFDEVDMPKIVPRKKAQWCSIMGGPAELGIVPSSKARTVANEEGAVKQTPAMEKPLIPIDKPVAAKSNPAIRQTNDAHQIQWQSAPMDCHYFFDCRLALHFIQRRGLGADEKRYGELYKNFSQRLTEQLRREDPRKTLFILRVKAMGTPLHLKGRPGYLTKFVLLDHEHVLPETFYRTCRGQLAKIHGDAPKPETVL